MVRLFEWFGRAPRKSGAAAAISPLAVERLEPRQMLAADAFLLVELGTAPAGGESVALYQQAAACDFGSDYVPAARLSSCLSSSDGGQLVHLQDVMDEIGELFEIEDPGEADLLPADSSWVS